MLFKIKLIGLFVAIMLFSAGVFAEDWSKKSFEDIKAAADSGDGLARFEIGIIFFDGEIVTKNYPEAFKYFKLAYDDGLHFVAGLIGHMYFYGKGVTKNMPEAAKYIRQSANLGNITSQSQLALMYLTGVGVPQDFHEAINLSMISAIQGDPQGQYILGTALSQVGNFLYSHMWLTIAASNGYEIALESRNLAQQGLSTQEVLRSQKMAKDCISSDYKKCVW